ncbi:hypothetical protein GCM10027290_11200 [Micromonospora sonneratiae]|uniref:Uncharacterized protein n=1 Tax=Micromonospora sonneratiae TaxID=1184706 RepID=A0ABW3YII0_9ACTN
MVPDVGGFFAYVEATIVAKLVATTSHDLPVAACREHTDRFTHLGATLTAEPPDLPCQQLAFLATTDQTDDETAERLLTHHHTRLDTHESPAHTFAFGDRDRELLSHHGYQPGQPIHLPDQHTIVPMRRAAQPRT